jgi:hypothetical protein
MDDRERSIPAPGNVSSFAWNAESGSLAGNQNPSASTGRTPVGSEFPRSRFIQTDLSRSSGHAYEQFLAHDKRPEVPLDAFGMLAQLSPSSADRLAIDKELLAAEPGEDCSWQASQGLARISLSPKSFTTPKNPRIAPQGIRGSSICAQVV